MKKWILGALFLMVPACSTPPEPGPDGDPVSLLTIVELHPDGNHVVTEAPLGGDGPGSQTQAIMTTTCTNSVLRISYLSNYGGSQICFVGAGTANLGQFCRLKVGPTCYANWAQSVGSYRTGSSIPIGYFTCQFGGDAGTNLFGANNNVPVTDWCPQHAIQVSIGGT